MNTIGDALKLDRRDLSGWPEESIKTILQMQKDNWRAVKNRTGHVTLYAPDEVTTIVASRSGRGARYLAEDLRRYENKQPILPHEDDDSPKTQQKWPCPRPNCQKVFVSDEKLSIHTAVDHEGMLVCPEEGCMQMFKRANLLGLHRSRKHGYVSPQYAKRKKQEENRKTVSESIPEVEETTPTVTEPAYELIEEKEIRGPVTVTPSGDVMTEITVETPDGDWGYTEVVRPLTPAGARPVELTEDILDMNVRTLIAVFKAAGMEVAINVADRA